MFPKYILKTIKNKLNPHKTGSFRYLNRDCLKEHNKYITRDIWYLKVSAIPILRHMVSTETYVQIDMRSQTL